jgi:DNA-binding IclR family transcriptional regulator
MGYNPMGHILLAQLDPGRAVSILRHNNANWHDEKSRQTEGALLEAIARARADGVAIGPGRTWPNASIAAMAVRLGPDLPALAIGVGGLNRTVLPRLDSILEQMRTLLEPWLIGAESSGQSGP